MSAREHTGLTCVDVHAHLLMPQLQQEMVKQAPDEAAQADFLELLRNGGASIATSGRMIRDRWPLLTDVDARLEQMERSGVEQQWVSPSPSHFYPWADEELAAWSFQEAHQILSAHIAQHPSRLSGLGLVPLQHPELCVPALEDAVLKHGFLGVEISSFAGRIELSNERLEPFWARAAELNAVIFLHPFGCSLDERLDRYYLSNSVGQPVENAVAISHLIFSGVLDRHPDLTIVAAHGGGYLPLGIGRADRSWHVRPEAAGCEHPPSSYLHRLYFDTVVHSEMGLKHLIEVVGSDRVVLGSDYPFDMGLDLPGEQIRETLQRLGVPVEATEAILGGTASRLEEAVLRSEAPAVQKNKETS